MMDSSMWEEDVAAARTFRAWCCCPRLVPAFVGERHGQLGRGRTCARRWDLELGPWGGSQCVCCTVAAVLQLAMVHCVKRLSQSQPCSSCPLLAWNAGPVHHLHRWLPGRATAQAVLAAEGAGHQGEGRRCVHPNRDSKHSPLGQAGHCAWHCGTYNVLHAASS